MWKIQQKCRDDFSSAAAWWCRIQLRAPGTVSLLYFQSISHTHATAAEAEAPTWFIYEDIMHVIKIPAELDFRCETVTKVSLPLSVASEGVGEWMEDSLP